ncbi:bactofilin family protein [Chromohalobacter nigrandesensis]|uniref:bactofilin family protein n=1 Tax=Chromohalobacter nigrandesensis TaxID=119863 RepID=UPI001FF2DCBE|nr:polymer-forming cytoskeletal protein [Chromohalobacter nigrandesensis]MCK0746097.1 polymer-forming cytoskeletal protein [Chromohalobacter nigrandesensis]
MGGGDVFFVLSLIALIIIVLDGKRRIKKRVSAAQPSSWHLQQSQSAPSEEVPNLPSQPQNPAKVDLPTSPSTETTQCLPASGGSLIGSTLRIDGDVSAHEALVISGAVVGNVTAWEHSVMVNEAGSVSPRIEARTVCVAGSVTGQLVATDQAIVLSSARVSGSIEAKRLKCESGAWLQSTVT